MLTYGEFSEYNIKQMNTKLEGDQEHKECLKTGNVEEDLEAKTVKKNYANITAKQRTKGTGNGALKVTGHMNYEAYASSFGMDDEKLKSGVKAYGQPSRHKEFSITALVEDEDGNLKYKAYPRCTITSNMTRKIENEGEEVAELELEIAVMPDTYGYGMYEALAKDLDESISSQWMTKFTSEMVREITA